MGGLLLLNLLFEYQNSDLKMIWWLYTEGSKNHIKKKCQFRIWGGIWFNARAITDKY